MFACTCTVGIACVQFDDTRIVSGSSDKTIKVQYVFNVIIFGEISESSSGKEEWCCPLGRDFFNLRKVG